MKKIQTEALVIGGGATGTGIIRDLAMRGLRCILVERRDLSDGTTGRFHGLLHSGGRYAVKDPLAAKECIAENIILRKIMPQCIEDTGGFFVLTPWDDPVYADQFILGCQNAGISSEEISIKHMLREEPRLNREIHRCFHVPDASADSFLASELNAESAQYYGAQIKTYHEISRLVRINERIVGAECQDLIRDEKIEILADIVVLAAGAWSGMIANTCGIPINIISGKGTMVAVNHRIVNTVINRCKLPSDGDILVPIHSVSVMGTTDVKVSDPDHYPIDPWEIQLMLEEGEKIIPGFSKTRILRAWAGVRPLYQESSVRENRELSRSFVLLDHADRDGIEGLITITSGKWTTYRKMAEVTSDLVCNKLGIERDCRTHLEALPGSAGKTHYLGAPLLKIEEEEAYGNLICECELVTHDQVVEAISIKGAKTIDDIRRETRLGMGPCQGGFCTYRVAGIMHDIQKNEVVNTNSIMRDFLRERWKGLLPVLWGSQLQQERLDELIYMNVLHVDRLPGPVSSRLGPTMYKTPDRDVEKIGIQIKQAEGIDKQDLHFANTAAGNPVDVLVIGGGLAGLTTALSMSKNDKKTKLITKGWGSLIWDSGCIDVMGHPPDDREKTVISPLGEIETLIKNSINHPYSIVGVEILNEALEFIKQLLLEVGYPLKGSLYNNWMLPTAAGTIRPTCLAPKTMVSGDINNTEPMLIIGIEGYRDFYAGYISDNLNAQGFLSNFKTIRLNSLISHRMINSIQLARMFDKQEFRDEVVQEIKPILGRSGRVGFPAVLGLRNAAMVHTDLEKKLDRPIFEIPGIPPSIPGLRLQNLLVEQIINRNGSVLDGMEALKSDAESHHLTAIITEAASRLKPHKSDIFVLATGGILGGGIKVNESGLIQETVLNLPIDHKLDREKWFSRDFSRNEGHPIFRYGLKVDENLRPVNENGDTYFDNLYAAGDIIGVSDSIREGSLSGIALATGYKLGKMITNNE